MIGSNPVQPTPPLVTRVEIKVGEMMFKNRPVPSHDRATVFLDRYGQYHHLTEQLPIGGVAGYKTLFLVDTSVFSRDLQLKLPSQDQASYFTAKVTVSWRVTDPVEAAKTLLVDVMPVVKPHVERVLRDIAITFPIEDGTAAERAMVHAFSGRSRQPLPQGISVLACDTALTLDASTVEHIRRLKTGRQGHLARKEELVHSAIEASAEQQLIEMRNQHELMIKRMQHEHQLQLDRQRVEMYSGVQHNQDRLIAIALAQDPSKAADLLALSVKQQQLEVQDARGVLEVMLDAGLVTRNDVVPIVGKATSTLAQRMTGASDGGHAVPLSHVPQSAALLQDALTAEVVPDSSSDVLDSLDFDEDDEDDV
ncbi:MAG TPA: hypothetical protein VNO31_37730 [Umezawaea sp.]|nr:hypothetical protein [Umezawaea sp.]